jgi:hypothetical protein
MDKTSAPPPLGPAWEGWESYNLFAESVKSDLRYVRSKAANSFLEEILASCATRKLTVPQKRIFWRARLGCEEREVTDVEDGDLHVTHIEERPHGRDGMKPIRNWQSEGRANPRGIPYLYLATERDTALAEVRPWIGAAISVARLEVKRDLNVIDCSKHHAMDAWMSVILDNKRPREDGIWVAIDRAFATPVSKDEESRDYIPTQIIAELFKSEGCDGIVYKSLLSGDGYNLALFNLDDASVVHCALIKVGSISFGFRETGTEAFYS